MARTKHTKRRAGWNKEAEPQAPPSPEQVLYAVPEPVEEKFEVSEESGENDANSAQNKAVFGAGKNFKRYTMSNKITYALTCHKIRKPREFLFHKLDYVVIEQDLYQIYDDFPLPELMPGFSYTQLRNTAVKAVKFQPQTAAQLSDRTVYLPEVTPVNIRIGDIKHFTDVYEPVGEDVEMYGVLLSFRATQLMQSDVNSNLVVPQHLKVEKRNIVECKQFKHCLCYAKKDINAHISVSVPKESQADVNQAIYRCFKAKQLDQVVDLLRTLGPQLSTIDNDDISERYVIRQAILEEKNIVVAVKEYQALYLKAAIILSQKLSDAAALAMLGRIYRCSESYPCFAGVICSRRDLSQRSIEEIFKLECKVDETRRAIETELGLALNNVKTMNALGLYIATLPFAYCCKNYAFVQFVLSKRKVFDAQTRELLASAQIKNLREKDIKCVCTAKKLMPNSVYPLQIAAFFDSKGILEKASKLEFEEALMPSSNKVSVQKGNTTEQSLHSYVVEDVLFACACNINDNVAWLKVLIDKFMYYSIDYERLLTAALVSMNRKIFAFLSMKQSTASSFIFSSAKYLLTYQHARMIKEMGMCTAESVKNFSFILSDDDLFTVINYAVTNNAFKLYNNDLLEKAIYQRKEKTLNIILRSGFSFPNSEFDYKLLTAVHDHQYILQITDIIVQQFLDVPGRSFSECFAMLIQGCITNENIALLKALFYAYEKHISADFLASQRSTMLEAVKRLVYAQHVIQCDQIFVKIIELAKVLNCKLIDGQSISVLQDFMVQTSAFDTADALCDACENSDAIIGYLDPRCLWQCILSLRLIQRIKFAPNGHYQGVVRYIAEMLSVMYDHEQSICLMSNQSISAVHPIYRDTLDLVLPNQILYYLVSGDREFQELVSKYAWKLSNKYQLEFLTNMKVRTYQGRVNNFSEDRTVFDELDAIFNDHAGLATTPVVQKSTSHINTLHFVCINHDLQLLSLLIQFFGEELHELVDEIPIIYHVAKSISIDNKNREFVQILGSSFKGRALYSAIYGLIRANAQQMLQILQKLHQMHQAEFIKFLNYQQDGKIMFHEVIALLPTLNQVSTKSSSIDEFKKLLPAAELRNLILLKDYLGQLAFVKHLESVRYACDVDFSFAPDVACNNAGENCLHLALRKYASGRGGRNRYNAGNGSSVQATILQALPDARLKKLLPMTDNSKLTPVHYISDSDAMKLALERVDIKQIDRENTIFKKMQGANADLIELLTLSGCDLTANITPVPQNEKIYEEYSYMADIFSNQQPAFVFGLWKKQLMDQEVLAQHLLAWLASQNGSSPYMQFLDQFPVFKQQRTAQLFVRYICLKPLYPIVATRRFAIKFGVYGNTDLLALVQAIPSTYSIFLLHSLGDLPLSEREVGKIIALSLLNHNFNEQIALVKPLISDQNAGQTICVLARAVALGFFKYAHYTVLEHILSKHMRAITDEAIYSMASVFLTTSAPAQYQAGQLIPKLVISKFFEHLSDDRLRAFNYKGATLLDVIRNSIIYTVDDQLVEQFAARLVSIGIAGQPANAQALPEPELVPVVNAYPELVEKYKYQFNTPPKLTPLSQFPGGNFSCNSDNVLYYKGRPLYMIGVQEQPSFSKLKYSLVKAVVKCQGNEFCFESGFRKMAHPDCMADINFSRTEGCNDFERPYDALDAFKKYVQSKSGYQYEYVLNQSLDSVQLPGKFKFIEIEKSAVDFAQNHFRIASHLRNRVVQVLYKHHMNYSQLALVNYLLNFGMYGSARIDMVFDDVAYLRQLEGRQLQNYLLTRYNRLASQRLVREFKNQIIASIEQKTAIFTLFCNVCKFVTEHTDFTFDDFLTACQVEVDSQAVSLPGMLNIHCFKKFPYLYAGGTLRGNMLMMKCNAALLQSDHYYNFGNTSATGLSGFVKYCPCFYAGGSKQQVLYRQDQYIVKEGKILKVCAKIEGASYCGPFGSVVPRWLSDDIDTSI